MGSRVRVGVSDYVLSITHSTVSICMLTLIVLLISNTCISDATME